MSNFQQTNSQGQWIAPTADSSAPGAIQAPHPKTILDEFSKSTHVATAVFSEEDDTVFSEWKIQTKSEYEAEQEAIRIQQEADAKPQQERQRIHQQIDTIDRQAVRPLRAVVAGTDTQADRDRIAELETEAEELRAELAAMDKN